MFLAFALLRCLERHWTVVLQTSAARVLIFNSKGVYAIPSMVDPDDLEQGLPRTTWCLVDSNTTLESVPDHILNLDLFLIQATSPRSNRTSWSKKRNTSYRRYILNPMPLDEAHLVCVHACPPFIDAAAHRLQVSLTARCDAIADNQLHHTGILRPIWTLYAPRLRRRLRGHRGLGRTSSRATHRGSRGPHAVAA